MKRQSDKTQHRKLTAGGSACFAVIFCCIFLGSFMIGRFPVNPADIFRAVRYDLFGRGAAPDEVMRVVLYNIRIPRILIACMVGAALSMAGAAYQGVFQNAMASPDVLGASSGAAFGAALAILLGAGTGLITFSAFCFSMLTVFLSWFISEHGQGKKVLLSFRGCRSVL